MLIDKSELLKAYDEAHNGPPGKARKLIEEAPGVEAVPLDKLCEWLQDNAALTYGAHISAHGWKRELTVLMEEQDAKKET